MKKKILSVILLIILTLIIQNCLLDDFLGPDEENPIGNFVINNDDKYTRISSVSLALSGIEGATFMRFGNTKEELQVASWEDFLPNKNWTLSVNNGEKTVYGEFKDGWDNVY